jgi:hypothetical protein
VRCLIYRRQGHKGEAHDLTGLSPRSSMKDHIEPAVDENLGRSGEEPLQVPRFRSKSRALSKGVAEQRGIEALPGLCEVDD